MATPTFKKASKLQAKLRLAFIGPSGSGKTYSALSVAAALVPGGRIAVIDTERGSASLYSDTFAFDVLELESFAPERYVEAIRAAEAEKYDVVIVDSLSHAWMGKDGALEQVDAAAKRDAARNSFAAWRHVTPKHNALVDAIVGCRAHIMATMRSKMEYVLEERVSNGRKTQVPRKVGMAPIQREGLEYEFTVVGDLDIENMYTITKTRCSALAGKVIERPGAELADVLRAWLADGAPAPALAPQPQLEPEAGAPTQQRTQATAPPPAPSLAARMSVAADRTALGLLVKEAASMPDGVERAAARAAYRARLAAIEEAEIAAAQGDFESGGRHDDDGDQAGAAA